MNTLTEHEADLLAATARDRATRAAEHIALIATAVFPGEHAYVAAKHLREALRLVERIAEEVE